MFSLGSTTHSIKTNKFSKKPLVQKVLQENLILPQKEIFYSTITEDGINKKLFIEKYKSSLKAINILKGKASLKFSFYEEDFLISSVEIIIRFDPKDKVQIISQKQIIRMIKNNL